MVTEKYQPLAAQFLPLNAIGLLFRRTSEISRGTRDDPQPTCNRCSLNGNVDFDKSSVSSFTTNGNDPVRVPSEAIRDARTVLQPAAVFASSVLGGLSKQKSLLQCCSLAVAHSGVGWRRVN
jgi:hypothetical protein